VRVAPRRSARRRSRIDWDRFGRIVLVLVLFTIVALYVNPVTGFLDSWSESRAEQQRLDMVRAEHREVAKRAKALEDPAALEREARKLGMVAEGERAYVIRGLGR
jgi:cell division protein FtsB